MKYFSRDYLDRAPESTARLTIKLVSCYVNAAVSKDNDHITSEILDGLYRYQAR